MASGALPSAEGISVSGRGRPSAAKVFLGAAAAVAAIVLAVTLAVRPIASYDVGYHLAYGEHFLKTGEIVQTNRFIYTQMPRDILSAPENLGPGCRYDAASDTYHFVNANWLSQAIMAAAWLAGGAAGLGILQAALIGAIFLTAAATMGRNGVGLCWIGPGLVLIALASYERFNIRPEVFGYLVLAVQLYLLIGPGHRWRRAVGVIVLQVLAVNLHSYFPLGAALAGAMFVGALLRWTWARAVTGADTSAMASKIKWLGIVTGGVLLACLANPWFVRGAIMPVRTLIFMGRHGIAGGAPVGGAGHPWAEIGEFFSPFSEGVRWTRIIGAYYVVLCLAGVAAVAGLARRRWGWLLAVAGMTFISTRMRRNIAPAAIIIVPLCMIILADALGALRGRLNRRGAFGFGRLAERANVAVAGLCLIAAAWWTVSTLSNRFYFSERRPWRFGLGVSNVTVPLESARWIDTNKPAGRVFCGYDNSSNLMYFIRPDYEVPILTNTWAYPPSVMRWVLDLTAGRRDFAPAVARYDIATVALQLSPGTEPLIKSLSKSPDWAVVHVGADGVVFLRRAGPNAELAREREITKKDFDVAGHIARVIAADPVGAFSLYLSGRLLMRLGWGNHAITVWRKAVELEPDYHEAIGELGRALALRGNSRMMLMAAYSGGGMIPKAQRFRRAALADWREAETLFERALEIEPGNDTARANLQSLRRQMADLARGVYAVPRMR